MTRVTSRYEGESSPLVVHGIQPGSVTSLQGRSEPAAQSLLTDEELRAAIAEAEAQAATVEAAIPVNKVRVATAHGTADERAAKQERSALRSAHQAWRQRVGLLRIEERDRRRGAGLEKFTAMTSPETVALAISPPAGFA